jgi:hypothetical protein
MAAGDANLPNLRSDGGESPRANESGTSAFALVTNSDERAHR